MSGQWNELFAPGSFSCDTMLLLTDGTVLVHDAGGAEGGADWLRLAPDGQGIYLIRGRIEGSCGVRRV